jgi:hypothetical protein
MPETMTIRIQPGLTLFVATRRDQVPSTCSRYVSVDGSVPGAAVTWDHHVTGELVNLDAMPAEIDASAFDGIGTTMADTDAIVSAAAVLVGGAAHVHPQTMAVLLSASHWCDHLGPHPAQTDAANAAGRGLHGHVLAGLAHQERSVPQTAFASLALDLASAVATGSTLPYDTTILDQAEHTAMLLDGDGRITRRGLVGVVDLRGTRHASPSALYARFDCPIGLFIEDHPAGGLRYTVGLHPARRGGPSSVRPVLDALARAEFAHGWPALGAEARPGMENWGGRQTVGGSPWNYGSRLSPDEVVAIIEQVVAR